MNMEGKLYGHGGGSRNRKFSMRWMNDGHEIGLTISKHIRGTESLPAIPPQSERSMPAGQAQTSFSPALLLLLYLQRDDRVVLYKHE